MQGYAGGGPLPTTTVVLQEDYEVVWLTFEVPGGGLLAPELSFCAGTDTGTACPCGSAPVGPLGGCPNSTGRGATAMQG